MQIETAQTLSIPLADLGRQHASIARELERAFDRVLGSSAFILGHEVERFEHEFAAYCEASYCVGVNSGTAALTIMLQAAGIGPGDEVIVPAHTFLATALAVLHAGAQPALVDVCSGTGLIDPAAVRAAIGPSTSAIIAVHLYGQPCAMEELSALSRRHGLALFEDAAQAHGARYQGRRVGTFGRASAFSFYPSKNLGALGDGGAICTDDADLDAAARRLRDLGRGATSVHEAAGYNERLDALQAAFLGVKLPYLDRWNAARRALANAYREALREPVALLDQDPGAESVYHLFPIRVSDRDEIRRRMRDHGIATGLHYERALPDQPALSMLQSPDTPEAKGWAATELSLPMFPELTVEEQQRVVESLLKAITVGL